MKVDQQSQRIISQSQIGQQLCKMHIAECFNGFNLQDKYPVDKNVDTVSVVKLNFLMNNRNRDFFLDIRIPL